jgi:hypothetical protein
MFALRLSCATAVKVSTVFRRIPSTTHPKDPNDDATVSDVAVLTLARPVTTATLAVASTPVAPGTALRVFGHGIRDGLPAGQLRADALEVGDFKALSTNQAAALWSPAASETGLQFFGDPNVYPTGGDSGGPVVRDNAGRPELVGMFSFGMEILASGNSGPGFAGGTAASVIASMLR